MRIAMQLTEWLDPTDLARHVTDWMNDVMTLSLSDTCCRFTMTSLQPCDTVAHCFIYDVTSTLHTAVESRTTTHTIKQVAKLMALIVWSSTYCLLIISYYIEVAEGPLRISSCPTNTLGADSYGNPTWLWECSIPTLWTWSVNNIDRITACNTAQHGTANNATVVVPLSEIHAVPGVIIFSKKVPGSCFLPWVFSLLGRLDHTTSAPSRTIYTGCIKKHSRTCPAWKV